MRILKAYADAGAMGQQSFGSVAIRDQQPAREKEKPSRSGDSISLSDEARELLASGGASMAIMPHDATYDKQGNVMRQLDSLQSDLRSLASEFMGQPGSAGVLGKLGSIQSQITGLRAQV